MRNKLKNVEARKFYESIDVHFDEYVDRKVIIHTVSQKRKRVKMTIDEKRKESLTLSLFCMLKLSVKICKWNTWNMNIHTHVIWSHHLNDGCLYVLENEVKYFSMFSFSFFSFSFPFFATFWNLFFSLLFQEKTEKKLMQNTIFIMCSTIEIEIGWEMERTAAMNYLNHSKRIIFGEYLYGKYSFAKLTYIFHERSLSNDRNASFICNDIVIRQRRKEYAI